MSLRYCSNCVGVSLVLIWVMLLLLSASSLKAEVSDIGLYFTLMSPKEDFGDVVNRKVYDISFEGVYYPSAFPIGFGLEISLINNGSDYYSSTNWDNEFAGTIPDMGKRFRNNNRAHINKNNFVFAGNILFRYKSDIKYVSPYIDIIFGINHLYNMTSLRGNLARIFSSNSHNHMNLSYGLGGGIMLPLARFQSFESLNYNVGLFLDFKVRYMFNVEAVYLKDRPTLHSEYEVLYDPYRSKTDMLLFQLGIALGF